MRGRFEKPRNSRNSVPQNPRQDYAPQYGNSYDETSYSQPGNSQGGYEENSYNGGYQPNAFRDNGYDDGGYSPRPQNRNPQNGAPKKEGCSFGWGILSFFIPLVGLILWAVWRKEKPRAAKASGIGALVGFILTLVLILVLVIGGKMYLNNMLDKMNHVEMTKPTYTQPVLEEEEPEEIELTEAPTTVATEPPHATRDDYVNFLVVGQAGRAGEEERFADTMMVFTLNKFDKTITITSLLRDSFVHPPQYKGKTFGKIKLTVVYHLGYIYAGNDVAGSMELMDMTLHDNFGLEIDHNIEIDFDVFLQIVDTLGGVDLEINEAEAKYLNKELKKVSWKVYDEMEPGMAHLDGWAALVYARMRKAEGDGDSDIKRTARQRKMIEAIMDKVKNMSLGDVQNLANAVLPMVTTNMTKDEIADTMMTLLPMLPELKLITGGTCPINYSGEMVDIYKEGIYHSVLKFNVAETSKAMREITLGEVAEPPKK